MRLAQIRELRRGHANNYGGLRVFRALRAQGITSRRGECWNNAAVESFFGTLKQELVHQVRFETRDGTKSAIFEYIEVFYNRQRLHSILDYVSPVKYEEIHANAALAA